MLSGYNTLKVPFDVPKTQWHLVNMPELDRANSKQSKQNKRVDSNKQLSSVYKYMKENQKAKTGWSWYDGYQLYHTERETAPRSLSKKGIVNNPAYVPNGKSELGAGEDNRTFTHRLVYSKNKSDRGLNKDSDRVDVEAVERELSRPSSSEQDRENDNNNNHDNEKHDRDLLDAV